MPKLKALDEPAVQKYVEAQRKAASREGQKAVFSGLQVAKAVMLDHYTGDPKAQRIVKAVIAEANRAARGQPLKSATTSAE